MRVGVGVVRGEEERGVSSDLMNLAHQFDKLRLPIV